MAKFRLRNLITRFPLLDKLRLDLMSFWCWKGIQLVDWSYDVTKIFPQAAGPYVQAQQQAIFAVYHGQMVGLLQISKKRADLCVLISQSRDGEIIARSLTNLGFAVARGSSKYKAVQGTVQLLKAAKRGRDVVITVDGPRGPRYEFHPGIIRLAEITGLPIVPFVCWARDFNELWGWDHFMFPNIGTPEVYLYGAPIFVPAKSDDQTREQLRLQLNDEIIRLRTVSEGYWIAAEESSSARHNVVSTSTTYDTNLGAQKDSLPDPLSTTSSLSPRC